jgi:cysteine desulfuration protein SufE
MALPTKLQTLVDQFRSAPRELRVAALLDLGKRVPPVPEAMREAGVLEEVHECQTPFFLATRVESDGAVHLFFDCPPEAPTVRGFAGMLYEGLEGATAGEILAVPSSFYMGIGLEEVVSPLRLRGMSAILARLKRQVEERLATAQGDPRSTGPA